MAGDPILDSPENLNPREPSDSENQKRERRAESGRGSMAGPGKTAKEIGGIPENNHETMDEVNARLRRAAQPTSDKRVEEHARERAESGRGSMAGPGKTAKEIGGIPENNHETMDEVNARARRAAKRAAQPTSDRRVEEHARERAEANRPERGGNAGPLGGAPPNAPPYTPPPGSVPNPRPGTYTPPIPGGGIAARVPGGPGFPSQWTPAPAMVLVLGAILIGVGLVTGQQISGGIVNLFWNQSLSANVVSNTWHGLSAAMGEGLFVLLLYILANLSDELARIAVIFELFMFLILFIMHPNFIVTLGNVVKGMTGN